jgi:imidazolonepropionase-like amidohydrolase
MKLLRISCNKKYLLIPDFVWDGVSARPQKNLAVFISNGLIKQVVPVDIAKKQPESDTIGLPGLFLMPGLVDCHVHFSMNCENLFQAIDNWHNRPALVMDLAREAAEDYLSNGVLAVRDGGDKMNIGLEMKHRIGRGDFPGPLVTATGQAIFRQGRYGDFLGPGIESLEEALVQVELFRGTGIDQLKVVISGLVSFKEYGVVGPLQFSTAELTEIVAKAHQLGLKVMAHASSAAAVETAVKSGVDSVEHGYFLETAQLEMMAEKKTAWIPTLSPLGNIVASGQMPYPGADCDVIKRSFELQLYHLYKAYKLGVNLGIGTDAGANQVLHGCSYHQELQYYSMAGLDNAAIIRLATSASAKIIGHEEKLGSIQPGKTPFLIGLSGNPFESLSHLKSPEIVIIPENDSILP